MDKRISVVTPKLILIRSTSICVAMCLMIIAAYPILEVFSSKAAIEMADKIPEKKGEDSNDLEDELEKCLGQIKPYDIFNIFGRASLVGSEKHLFNIHRQVATPPPEV